MRRVVKWSDSFGAEVLLKNVAVRVSGRKGSTAVGAREAQALRPRTSACSVNLQDGSGLCRKNKASPREVVRLLNRMRPRRNFPAFFTGASGRRPGRHALQPDALDSRSRPLQREDRDARRRQQPVRLLPHPTRSHARLLFHDGRRRRGAGARSFRIGWSPRSSATTRAGSAEHGPAALVRPPLFGGGPEEDRRADVRRRAEPLHAQDRLPAAPLRRGRDVLPDSGTRSTSQAADRPRTSAGTA